MITCIPITPNDRRMPRFPRAGPPESSRVNPARPLSTLADDVRSGLLTRPRQLPPKYFYDDHGSRLFEAICDTPEYYPTRAEAALLAAHAGDIIERTAPAHLLELGSGSSRKTRHLLDACDAAGVHCHYWPFDVSARMMLDAGADLMASYDWLNVHALIGDYTGGLAHVPLPEDGGARLIVFLGGTLGNFGPAEAVSMLREIHALMDAGDHLLIGLDRVKDCARLEAAYDDAQGLTAAFNRNVLTVLNRELEADFPVDAYEHRALFDARAAQVEMRLVCRSAHRVRLGTLGTAFDMSAGEEILTEISRKFTPFTIASLLADAGLRMDQHFEAENGDYSLVVAVPD